MAFLVSEEDYLSHYGRKGMKWYQHIFGDDKSNSGITNKKFDEATKSKIKESIKLGSALLYTGGMIYLGFSPTGASKLVRSLTSVGKKYADRAIYKYKSYGDIISVSESIYNSTKRASRMFGRVNKAKRAGANWAQLIKGYL